MKKSIVGLASLLLLTSTVLLAQGHVSPSRHPNLAAAQRFCADAIQKITAGQQANEWDMGGHAKKAKELLTEASEEIKQAALAANANGH
jgi:hypothetical protein